MYFYTTRVDYNVDGAPETLVVYDVEEEILTKDEDGAYRLAGTTYLGHLNKLERFEVIRIGQGGGLASTELKPKRR